MINKHRLGVVLGAFLGSFHFIWAWLVLTGMAQPLMNWIFRLHLIDPPYVILPFNLGLAVALILITSATGYVSGWILGAIWNWLRTDALAPKSVSTLPQTPHARSA